MLFFLELDVLPGTMLIARNRADPAEFDQFPELCFFGLQDTERTDPRVAGFTVAGIDSTLTSWHSCGNLLEIGYERKTCKDDQKAQDFEFHRLTREKFLGSLGWHKENDKAGKTHDHERLDITDDRDKR